jgi:hypothetical protein
MPAHDLQLGLTVEGLVAQRTLVQSHYLTALPGLQQVLEVSRVLIACPELGVWTLAVGELEPQQVLAALQQVQASHLSQLPRPRRLASGVSQLRLASRSPAWLPQLSPGSLPY